MYGIMDLMGRCSDHIPSSVYFEKRSEGRGDVVKRVSFTERKESEYRKLESYVP